MMIIINHIRLVRHHTSGPKKGQSGQAVIELSLMMTFLAIILLALVIIHELGYKNILAIEKLRNDMRISMDQKAPGPFARNMVRKEIFVDVPGRMKDVLGGPFISQTHKIEYYEGSYQGTGDSFYKKRKLYREILIQD